MSQKSKTILLLLLLMLSLSGAIYTAKAAIGAVGCLHAQQKLYQSGDVRAIRPWMTIAYIAHTYHVPESYLYQALGIKDRRQYQGTLQTIAGRLKRPVNDIIHSVQGAILAYRKHHPLPPALPGRAYIAGRLSEMAMWERSEDGSYADKGILAVSTVAARERNA